MARPTRYYAPMETVTIRVAAASWAELGTVAGDLRPEVVRQLIDHYLRPDLAGMPSRPPVRPTPLGRSAGPQPDRQAGQAATPAR